MFTVLFWQIWYQPDFDKLVNATVDVLKYSHYFHRYENANKSL